VLADLIAPTALARVALAAVLADLIAPTVLARVAMAAVLALISSPSSLTIEAGLTTASEAIIFVVVNIVVHLAAGATDDWRLTQDSLDVGHVRLLLSAFQASIYLLLISLN
jgi:hypothetical protein